MATLSSPGSKIEKEHLQINKKKIEKWERDWDIHLKENVQMANKHEKVCYFY